ncbi:MAG: alanine--tRNA ligase [Candidatus Paceibacterota bacterium]
MTSNELRKKFLDFFESRGHKIIASSSLLPTDPSVLFTTAGMQQFSLYLSGKKDALADFGTRHLASCQKCFRTGDIEEIGDDTHHTFFEMLGNWSIGQEESGYFKQGAIEYALEFLVNELKMDKSKFTVTVFQGEGNIPKDTEAMQIWLDNGIPAEHIKEFSKKDNFWGPTSDVGPCGPCSEIHYDRGEEFGCGKPDCGPSCDNCKRFVEIWNLVFMQYYKDEKGRYELLPQTNIDTGIGFERLVALLNNKKSAYETDIFLPVIEKIEQISGKKYEENKKIFRIIADHARSTSFLLSEGVAPSNLGQGYVLRRILRRAVRYGKLIDMQPGFLIPLVGLVIEKYKDIYPDLEKNKIIIETGIETEEQKFEKTLQAGLKKISDLLELKHSQELTNEEVFDLYQSYGFPIELTEEIAAERGFKIDKIGISELIKKHQELSRAGAEKKFGGVGKDAGEEGAKLHTATHLLHSALRKLLGSHVEQMGSDINMERLRFDFKHSQKLLPEQIKDIEDLVNEKIKQDLEIKKQEMPIEEALQAGALAFFKEKYPDLVKVWTMQNPQTGEVFSKEICAGPHAESTGKLGCFKIIKEESSSAGVRRIKATLN